VADNVSMVFPLSRAFDSLGVRNYRLFFTGQVVSWTGTWVQWVAQGWLILRITDSGLGLGLVTAMQWLPVLLFGAWGGVLADRFNKRRVLMLTNFLSGLLSLLLGVVTIAGAVNLTIVIVVALALGFVTAVDNPTRQTFTMEMVGRSRLTNAVSLNTATFTIARILGPTIAGFLIAGVGIGECFLVNAVSFVPILVALTVMKKEDLHAFEGAGERGGGVLEGFKYVLSVPVLRMLLTIMAVVGTLQYNFQVILPVLAKETFAGDARTLGLLGAFLGVGMFIGSMTNAAIGRPTRKYLVVVAAALGSLTLVVAGAPEVWIATAFMIPLGAASMGFLATMNSSLQLTSSDSMRGRVMALYFVLFLGSTPIGAPIVGWIAEAFNPRAAMAVGGIVTLGACLYGWLKLPAHLVPIEKAGDEDRPVEPHDLAPEAARS
jgi:MFS family permease